MAPATVRRQHPLRRRHGSWPLEFHWCLRRPRLPGYVRRLPSRRLRFLFLRGKSLSTKSVLINFVIAISSTSPSWKMNPNVFTHCSKAHAALRSVILLSALLVLSLLSPFGLAQDPSRFEKEVLAGGLSDPLQLDIAADGRIFFIERKGA